MSIPDPIQNPASWDHIVISDVTSPGLCNVGEFKRKWEWDEKKGKGAQGAVLTYTNKRAARGSLEFLLLAGPDPNNVGFQYQMLDEFVLFAQLFQYNPTKSKVNAVSIYHPSFATMGGLLNVVCEDISNFVRVKIGLYAVRVALIEYAPPLPVSAVSTPTASKTKSSGPLGPPGAQPSPADAALQRQIAAQLAIAQAPL